jgi:adenylate cyclase
MSEEHLTRRLAALVSADVVGYSRLMADDELATVRSLAACREKVTAVVRSGGGRVVDFVGDNMLAEFPNTLDAVGCALAIHRSLADFNAGIAENRRLSFRIGVHLGDVMDDGDRIYGDGINIAARLEALAEPGGVCISDDVYRQIRNKFNFECVDLGEQELKNIAGSVRVYRIVSNDSARANTAPARTVQPRSALPPSAKPSLAVLPFVNLSDDSGQDHFAAGLTLDIMAALIRIPGLFLIGEETMLSYRATPLPLRDIGRRLGVSHVLDGGVRRSGNRVRVTARLFETAAGRQLWAERYDRNLDDIFAIQDDITVEIVSAMDVQLVSGEPGRIVRQALKDPAAIEAYYRGWGALLGSSPEDVVISQQMFEDTARLEPRSSLGYAMAAWAHWWSVEQKFSGDVERSLNRAEMLAREALKLEDVTGMAELVLAEIHLYKKEYDQALAASERAVLARPSCSESFATKATVLNYLGRPAEAVELALFAIRLSPVYPPYYAAVLASAYYGCGRFEEALDAAGTCLASDPENLAALLVTAAAGMALGRAAQAGEAADTVRRVNPGFTLAAYAADQPYKDPGRLQQMVEMLKGAGLT